MEEIRFQISCKFRHFDTDPDSGRILIKIQSISSNVNFFLLQVSKSRLGTVPTAMIPHIIAPTPIYIV